MSKQTIRREIKKAVRKEEKSSDATELKHELKAIAKSGAAKMSKTGGLPPAVKALKGGNNFNQQTYAFLHRNFSRRDAARLAWMLCVADPFRARPVPVPPMPSIGVSTGCPRIYPITLKGFAVVNASGCAFVGANADAWLPNPTRALGAMPAPAYCYLGNAAVYGGNRGCPVHYTVQAYAGTTVTGSTGRSYPGPAITAAASTPGLSYMFLPDKFIDTQTNCDAPTGNAFQTYQNVAVGLRVRPSAPASGALVNTGVILMVQQIQGDTVVPNPAAASGTSVVGGADCYGYMSGLGAVSTNGSITTPAPFVPPSDVSKREWAMDEWPVDGDGESTWLEAAAIPNQSCCFAQWTSGNQGSYAIGYPQVAAIIAGATAGQVIEWEAKYVYAYYGTVSYQMNTTPNLAPVPQNDLESTVMSGLKHLQMGGAKTPAHAAVQAVAQSAVDEGTVHPKAASNWLNAGKQVIEAATGSSIGDIIGEGLGFLAAALL